MITIIDDDGSEFTFRRNKRNPHLIDVNFRPMFLSTGIYNDLKCVVCKEEFNSISSFFIFQPSYYKPYRAICMICTRKVKILL